MRRTIVQSAVVFGAILMTIALAGCGGSSNKTASTSGRQAPTPPTPVPIMGLLSGHTLESGTIEAGASQTIFNRDGRRSVIKCLSGGPDCVIEVAANGSATSTGGTVRVETASDLSGLPEGHTLMSGTIKAGEDETVFDKEGRRVVVACPTGGADCVIYVSADGVANSTGGVATITSTPWTALDLPDGHTLMSGTIDAGEEEEVFDAAGKTSVVACPAGDTDCVIYVADGVARSQGGRATATTTDWPSIGVLPDGHELESGTIDAGDSEEVFNAAGRRTVVTCAAGGADCVVHVAAEGGPATSKGGKLTVVTTTMMSLPSGHVLARDVSIPAGQTRRVYSSSGTVIVISCPQGGKACRVTGVAADNTVTWTGGLVTSERTRTTTVAALGLPDGHTLTTRTIKAGADPVEVYNSEGTTSTVTCPEDGQDCRVTVASSGAVTISGGTLEVLTTTTLGGLPDDHDLETQTIQAGGNAVVSAYSKGRSINLSCPSGGEACAIIVDDGTVTYNSGTGGTPTVVTTTNEIVWQANNGPDGDSDGAHAKGIADRMDDNGVTSFGTPTTAVSLGDPERRGSIVQSTLATEATVTPTVSWATSSTSPNFGMVLSTQALSTQSRLDPRDGELEEIDSNLPRLGEGWRGATLRKEAVSGGRSTVATIYSNIEPPTPGRPQATVVSGLNLAGSSDLSEITASITNPATVRFGVVSPVGTQIEVEVTQGVTPRDWATLIPNNTEIDVTVTYRDTGGTLVTSRAGHMECTAVTGCQAQGGLLIGTWEIVLDAQGATRPSGNADSYAFFGTWLSLPNDAADGEYVWGVFADAPANTLLTETQVQGNTGTAVFEGPATGLYARGEYGGTGSSRAVVSGEVGSFTAQARLDADFGASTTAIVGVDGRITDFRENGESLGNWSLTLEEADDSAFGAVGTNNANILLGQTTGESEGRPLRGQWGVQFVWDADAVAVTGIGLDRATGTFTASTSTTAPATDALHIVGAFGTQVTERNNTLIRR